jgi:hypothetical protein
VGRPERSAGHLPLLDQSAAAEEVRRRRGRSDSQRCRCLAFCIQLVSGRPAHDCTSRPADRQMDGVPRGSNRSGAAGDLDLQVVSPSGSSAAGPGRRRVWIGGLSIVAGSASHSARLSSAALQCLAWRGHRRICIRSCASVVGAASNAMERTGTRRLVLVAEVRRFS